MTYLRDKFRGIFQVNEPPHRIALAFAAGVFMAISPFLGLHYIGGLALALIFRLNKLIAAVGVTVSNPWTLLPISTFCAWLGAKLLGIDQVLPEVDWGGISFMGILGWLENLFTDFDNVSSLISELMPLIKAFFTGSIVAAVISSIASYFIVKALAARYQKTKDA